MSKNINNVKLLTTVCGGQNCQVVITITKPEQFNFNSINNTPGSCAVFGNFTIGGFGNYGSSIRASKNINVHSGKESLICDCKDTYTENVIILKDINGTIVKSK